MGIVLAVVVVLSVLVSAVIVGVMFVWAAVKDGEYDKATRARLRIPRRARRGGD